MSILGSAARTWTAVAILLVVLRLPSLYTEVVDPDEAGHAVGAWVLMDGGLPYVDYIDNKQPLVYWTYAAVFTILGRDLRLLHLAAVPWLLATAWCVALIGFTLGGERRHGRLAALLFALFSPSYLDKDMLATNTEVLMNLPLTGAVALYLARRSYHSLSRYGGTGLLIGLAVLYNLKAGIIVPVLVLHLLITKRTGALLPLVLMALGFTLPVAGVATYFAARDALQPMLFWNLLLNFKYAGAGNPLWTLDFKQGVLFGFIRVPLFMLSCVVLWFAAGASVVRRWRRKGRSDLLLVAAWTVLTFVPVAMGGRFYGHYFIQFYPPLAALAALWLADVVATQGRRLVKIMLAAGVVLPVAGFFIASTYRVHTGQLEGVDPRVFKVARYVQQHTCPEQRIFVWGYWSQLYYHAARPPASRFVYPQTLAGYVPGNPNSLSPNVKVGRYMIKEHWDQLFEDLEAHPPTLFINVSPAGIHYWENYPVKRYPRLVNYLDSHFVWTTVVDGVVIYRNRSHMPSSRCR